MYGDNKNYWKDHKGLLRPRRTGGNGPWTGLWFSIRSQKIPSYVDAKPGIVVNNIFNGLFLYSSTIISYTFPLWIHLYCIQTINVSYYNLYYNIRVGTSTLKRIILIRYKIYPPIYLTYMNVFSVPFE